MRVVAIILALAAGAMRFALGSSGLRHRAGRHRLCGCGGGLQGGPIRRNLRFGAADTRAAYPIAGPGATAASPRRG